MKQRTICKTLAVAVILLLSLSVTKSIGIPFNDDTTPPVTTHTLDPPEPDGLNGWYVSDVNVTLTATDDLSGVKVTYYRINKVEWMIYTEPFILSEDGINIFIEYYSVDNAGNIEDVRWVMLAIDQTSPNISISNEFNYDLSLGFVFLWTATAEDTMSGMERVEFYINFEIQETIYGPGPVYRWKWDYSNFSIFKGFIFNREITEEYVKFRVIFVVTNESIDYDAYTMACAYDNAGNKACDMLEEAPPPRYINWFLLLRSLKLPNNYTGYVGRFLIHATFYTG